MLTIDMYSAPRAVTLVCAGRLVLGVEAETLRCMAIARPERRMVVDMEAVEGIDAAGLGLLVELHRRAVERAGQLVLANPTSRVRRLLALTKLNSVLDIAPESEELRRLAQQQAMSA